MIKDTIEKLNKQKLELIQDRNKCTDNIDLIEINLKLSIIKSRINYELFKKNTLKNEVVKYKDFVYKQIIID